MIMNGTLIRKTEPHQKWFEQEAAEHRAERDRRSSWRRSRCAIAVRRCFSSWNMFRISASVEGIRVAPADPQHRAGGDQLSGGVRVGGPAATRG